jgi:hypothetical protein
LRGYGIIRWKFRKGDINMESPIDQRYRLQVLQYYQDGLEFKGNKFIYYCPFCQVNRKHGKYYQKKGGMFWVEQWKAWRFNCMKCDHSYSTMYQFLQAINPSAARNYQWERYLAQRTGKGTDCPNPDFHKKMRSTGKPRFRSGVGIHTHSAG